MKFHFKQSPMRKFCFITFCLSLFLVNYSNGIGFTKKPDYARVLNQSICRLNSHPKSQRAKRKVTQTYYQAINFYQQEIDRILMDNEPLKWTKTLDILENVNGLGDEIIYNSVASQLICEPKIYTTEIADVRQKAAAELYEEGISCLNQNSKEKAKEAYFYFVKAGKLNPAYQDIGSKIQEAKGRATLRVIINTIPAHTQNDVLGFSTEIFYQTMFYKLREIFPYSGFINFYSPEEVQKQKIVNPDQTILIEIFDFELESKVTTYGGEVIPFPSHVLKLVDGKYVLVKYVGPPNNRISNQKTRSELLMKANTILKIGSLSDNKTIYKDKIPWNYTEELNYSYKSGISQEHVSFSPDNQIFFDHFSLSLSDQVVDRLSQFFNPYNQ